MKVKDYLVLKNIYDYLNEQRDDGIIAEQDVNDLTKMLAGLNKIIEDIENED